MPINEQSTSAELFEAAKAALLREIESAQRNRPTFHGDPGTIWGIGRVDGNGDWTEAALWFQSPVTAIMKAEGMAERYHPGSPLIWVDDTLTARGQGGSWRVYSRTLLP